jgi:hypothetical protein
MLTWHINFPYTNYIDKVSNGENNNSRRPQKTCDTPFARLSDLFGLNRRCFHHHCTWSGTVNVWYKGNQFAVPILGWAAPYTWTIPWIPHFHDPKWWNYERRVGEPKLHFLRNFGIYRKDQAKISAQLKIAWNSRARNGREFSKYRRLTPASGTDQKKLNGLM